MKVQVAVLDSQSLSLYGLCGRKTTFEEEKEGNQTRPAERHAAREVARYVIHKRRTRIERVHVVNMS